MKKILFIIFNALIFSYINAHSPIDVVFVCHVKDKKTLDLAIDGIKKNGVDVRNVYVVASQKLSEKATWFDETRYPFSKFDVALELFNNDQAKAHDYANNPKTRLGWIYQQLLKLYAPFVIPEISSNVLMVDADTIFLNKTNFIDEYGNTLFNPHRENILNPYLEHAKRLIPGFKQMHKNYSGVAHHMLFDRSILEDLFNTIRSEHQIEPWRALCKCIDPEHFYDSGLSEYELYFNTAFAKKYPVKMRKLLWTEVQFQPGVTDVFRDYGYHYISCHTWM